jgi:hypothetical protein
LKVKVGWDMAVKFFVNLAATFYVWLKDDGCKIFVWLTEWYQKMR